MFGFRRDPETGVVYMPEEEARRLDSRPEMTPAEMMAETEALMVLGDPKRSLDDRLGAVSYLRSTEMLSEAEAAFLITRLYNGGLNNG